MKHTLKRFIYIALLTVFFIVVLIPNSAIATESKDEEYKKYTIEDIVYNRVPLFDINVFSDTAGGEDIKDNSIVSTIRTVIATWYVSIRNVVAILLGILLVYTGLRMAIATVASDRAKYKEFLIGWLKSIIILFSINYVLIIVLNLNDLLVSMFSKGSSSESQMYETIRTRAYDIRYSIGMTGMFMYITMIIVFIRFCWVYIKRTFTVLVLIVLAPIISAKYAFDSATGKKSKAFSEWLYQFSANVLIQSVHALLYTSLVGISLDISTENLTGFVISLIFLNFMLSADKIVLRIFKFEKHVEDLDKPFKKEESLAGVYYTYGAVKMAKRGTKFVGHKMKVLSYSPKLRTIKNKTENVRNNALNSVDNTILSINNRIINRLENSTSSNSGNNSGNNSGRNTGRNTGNNAGSNTGNSRTSNGVIKATINRRINEKNKILILKKASRRKGSAGNVAKQTLKLRKEQNRAVFKGNYKFIKNNITGIGSVVLAVPVMVLNPETGIGLFSSGISNLIENGKAQQTQKYSLADKAANVITLGQYINRIEQQKSEKKKNQKIEDTINTMLEVNDTLNEIESEIEKYDEATKKIAKSVMKAHYMSSVKKVEKYMKGYMEETENKDMDVAKIDEHTKIEMVNYVVGIISRGSKLDERQKSEIIEQAKRDLDNKKYGTDKKENMKKMASVIRKSVRSNIGSNRFTNEINLINRLEKDNNKLFASLYDITEDETTEVIDIENYIDTL